MVNQLPIFLNVALALLCHLANLKTHAIESHNKTLFLIPVLYLGLDWVESGDQVQDVLFEGEEENISV